MFETEWKVVQRNYLDPDCDHGIMPWLPANLRILVARISEHPTEEWRHLTYFQAMLEAARRNGIQEGERPLEWAVKYVIQEVA